MLAGLMVFSVLFPVFDSKQTLDKYDISRLQGNIISEPIDLYAQKLVYDKQAQKYVFNGDYKGGGEVAGQSYAPKIVAEFGGDKNRTVSVRDPMNEVNMSLTPQFRVQDPMKKDNFVIYPVSGMKASTVFTLKGTGIKEDIVLFENSRDKIEFKYEIGLDPGLEPRLEKDGSIGVYGVDSRLLGSVSTGSEEDAKLLEKARLNSPKNRLIFNIPAPVVIESGKDSTQTKVKSWFSLDGKQLTVHASNLKGASYPLSIDPSVYVETAKQLMRGNNETNIDFDTNNELIQKSQTTGARIDAWSSTTNLTSAVWGQGTAVAGGYIYSVGGVGSANTITSTYNTAGSNSYVVPAGVTSVTVKAWGGGGSGGNGDGGTTGFGGSGGGGGYAKAVISVTPGETLTVTTGSGGADSGTVSSGGGNGGGYSSVDRSGTFLVQAGGGGGGGGARGNNSGNGGAGGAGGGATAPNGSQGASSGGGGGFGGSTTLTGTPSDGGTAGTGGTAGASGVANAGGNGAGSDAATCNDAMEAGDTGGNGGFGGGGADGNDTSSCSNGGGGGGGRFGGGGGGSTTSNNVGGGGGGGGSSLVTGTATVETAGSGQTPGNSADSDRGGMGDGGSGGTSTSGGTAGDDGIVLISYVTPGSVANAVYWAEFNTSTNAIQSPNPGTGACGGWCTNSAYNLPTALTNLSVVAYNGFLYAIGGSNSSGTPQTTVYIAKIGANGEPQLWHPSGGTPVYWYSDTALSNARSQFSAVAYNNRMYLLGGLTTSTTVLNTNTVQYADINPMGTFTAWTSTGMSALSTARYGLTAHTYNGFIYVLGGNATLGGSPVSTVEYAKLNDNGTMNAWVATSSIVGGGRLTVGGSFSTIFSGYMYIAGGCLVVDSNGYCTSIATDVQLASINADGSLAPWNTILGLSNDRFAHTLIAWQGGLYRLGGCRNQDTGTGQCLNTALDVDYGVINPDGEASTVANSVSSGNAPCNGSNPYNCNLPSASVGNMLNASAVLNGYLYIMGGCTNNACTSYSAGVTYQAISSTGTLERPSSCAGTYTDSYCVSSVSLPNSRGAAGVTVFNNRIYLVGGFPSRNDISHTRVNADGSITDWTTHTFANLNITNELSYTFAYARANPSLASTFPGNLFIFGGCATNAGGVGCTAYTERVYKCNISPTGDVVEADANDCDLGGQLQIGTVTGNDGNPAGGVGLGAHAGAVYANYIYLMGGLAPGGNGTDLTRVRYARFDDNNNVVTVGTGWVEGTEEMNTGRRRGAGFGYNGFLYVLGGYDGADAIADIEFAKINVSDGSWEAFDQSSVTIQKRWGLTAIVSNSYAYVIGGCTDGAAPGSCNTRTDTIQTFQVYNNDSGTPVGYNASANQFATDRYGASTAILNGYIYVAGGCTSTADCNTTSSNVQFASIDVYGNIGTWADTADSTLPNPRAWGQLEVAGGTLYYIGGQSNDTTRHGTVYWGTPVSGNVSSWASATNELAQARAYTGGASWNNRIYITGGLNAGGSDTNSVYVSPDLSAGGDIGSAWTTTTTFDVNRYGHTTIAYANNLYVLGGYDGANYLNDVQFTQINSDGTLDAWTNSTSLPGPIAYADGFAANGYMYLIGGRNSDTDCSANTYVAPISANTTIATGNNPTGVGEWFETNVRYDGRRFGNSVAYDKGKYYVSGGMCNGFPTIRDKLTQNFSTASATHNVIMPATVNSGDLLLVLFTSDGTTAVTDPDGGGAWTEKALQAGTGVQGSVWAKVADGTEDATTVNFATGATSEEASTQTFRIPSGEWSGSIAGVEAVANNTGSTAGPDTASLNPGAWGTENTLWIAFAGGSSYTSVDSYPTGFSGGTHNLSNTGTNGASVSTAWQESASASVDPGAFGMSNSTNSIGFTIGIRPSGPTLTGANSTVQTAVYSQPQLATYSRLIDTDTDVFPNSWLMNGLDNSTGARWQARYRSMHDLDAQVNPNEDCGTSATMPAMTTWGQDTNEGDVFMGDVSEYIPLNSSGGDINCARYYYFFVSIDASRTFGYPEDVNRGPTIYDISLFFTSDPSKRLRHGKTFTGGEKQPLDTPCRQDVDGDCPLPAN